MSEDKTRTWLVVASAATLGFTLVTFLVLRSSSVARFDQDVMTLMWALREPGLTRAAQILTDLGSYGPLTIVEMVLVVVVVFRTRRLLEPVVFLMAVVVSARLVELLKVLTVRVRPATEAWLGPPVYDLSFPSGHTATSVVVFVLGALLIAAGQRRRVARLLLLTVGCALGILIGLSRFYLGYHWLTDVVGGWLLALVLISIGMAVTTATPRLDPDWQLQVEAPSQAPARARALLLGDGPGRQYEKWPLRIENDF